MAEAVSGDMQIEPPHEFSGAAVVNIPKRKQESPRAGIQQTARKSHRLINGQLQGRGRSAADCGR
jgi:hypothetical protein